MKAPDNNLEQRQAEEGKRVLNFANAEPGELDKNSAGERIPPCNWFEKDRERYLELHPAHKLAPSLGWIPEQLEDGSIRWWDPECKERIPDDAIIIEMP